jgi:hypothetical protein
MSALIQFKNVGTLGAYYRLYGEEKFGKNWWENVTVRIKCAPLARRYWVEAVSEDGQHLSGYCNPFNTERTARKYAKQFIKDANAFSYKIAEKGIA